MVLATLLAALALAIPFADMPLPGSGTFLPAYAAAVLLNDVITAVLLFAIHSVRPSGGLLVLAVGYLFAGLTAAPWALTFPGVFAPDGLLGAGLQSTATIAAARRIIFPLAILAYATLKHRDAAPAGTSGNAVSTIVWSVLATIGVVAALTWVSVAADEALPRFMADRLRETTVWAYIPAAAVVICVAALVLLWVRRQSVLDLWLMIVLVTLLIETLLLAWFSAGRFSLGWWAGRAYGLASASVVLLVLLAETTTVYHRLLRSLLAERRLHEARLTTMEAMAASIAHEVNQPLASVVTNAGAAARWLDRETPNLDEAREAMKRIVADGHRASAVIQSVRTAFRAGPGERTPLAINAVIRQALDQTQEETRLAGVTVRTSLGDSLPRVSGNPIQLQQVMVNLISNAIDAMTSVKGRPRLLHVTSEAYGRGRIEVAVRDTGPGLEPEHRNRIFEPFFTTKSHGMGMGLMISRTIVEAHGGRIWMTPNEPEGATLHFTLPTAGGSA